MIELITIILNGEERSVLKNCSVDMLVESFSIKNDRIAIELNEKVIARSLFHQTCLSPMDRVEIITAVGGG